MSLPGVPMNPEQQRELRLTLALAAGWIIRAVEEFGVGGPNIPESEQFVLASQMVMERITRLYVALGCVPEFGKYTPAQITAMLIDSRGALPDEQPEKLEPPS